MRELILGEFEMIVKYSNITYEEVKQERSQALRPLPGSTREAAFSLLKLSSFALCWGFLLYIMGKYYGGKMFSFLCSGLSGLFPFDDAANFLLGTLYAIIFTIFFIVLFTTFYFKYVNKLIKTPIADKEKANHKFYDKTVFFENIMQFQEVLKQRKVDDLQYLDIYIDGNLLEVHIKDSEHGFITKYKYSMTEEEKESLLGNAGILDFTYLDNIWSDYLLFLESQQKPVT